jgi:hypothetical protein
LQQGFYFSAIFLIEGGSTFAQKSNADSLSRLLAVEKKDTNRVRLMWQMAGAVNMYDPDTAVILSQQALYLSQR